jgi:hypothetical protein
MTGYEALIARAQEDDANARRVLAACERCERDAELAVVATLAIATQLQALRSELALRAFEGRL